MEKKTLKKLSLNKSIVATLSDEEQASLKGGGSSRRKCTGFLCCNGPGASMASAPCAPCPLPSQPGGAVCGGGY